MITIKFTNMMVNWSLFLLVCFFLSFNMTAGENNPFQSFVMLEGDNSEKTIAAIIEEDHKTYALTTQSIFELGFSSISVFDFEDRELQIKGFEISKQEDLLRIQLENDGSLRPFTVSHENALGKSVYAMELRTGAVWRTNDLETMKEKLDSAGFVLTDSGALGGVIAKTADYKSGEGFRLSLIKLSNSEKWVAISQKKLKTQIDKLLSLQQETKSVEALYQVISPNQYIPFSNKYHRKHFKWLKDHNVQYLNFLLDTPHEEESKKSAMREHRSRCFNFTELKRLLFFAHSASRTCRKYKWFSDQLNVKAQKLLKRNDKIQELIKQESKRMVEAHPATKYLM